MKKNIYFPGLNGLRAISAIAVVVSHITGELELFNLPKSQKYQSLGVYGVSIFFVLSGFLITFLLLTEKEVQPINVKKFYIRRILRIWPLYYLYLILAIVALIILGLNLNIKSLLLYIFFAANIPLILKTSLPYLGHYWSLGVEEQFYLFWPWIIKWIDKYIIPVIIFLITTLVGVKVLLHLFYPGTLLEVVLQTIRFQCMMIGALGAILYKQGNILFLKISDNKISQSICWFTLMLIAIDKFHVASIIDHEIIAIVALVLIIGQIKIKNRIINLELNFLNFIGKISYGIYVIHPLLIYVLSIIFSQINMRLPFKYWLVYLLVVGVTILISFLLYKNYESYFLNFKKKFVVVKSSPTKKGEYE